LGEIEQDRVAVEHRGVAVDDRRHLGVGIDRQEPGLVLLALARVDRHDLVGQRHLFETERDLGRVGREVEIELDHDALLFRLGAGRRAWLAAMMPWFEPSGGSWREWRPAMVSVMRGPEPR